MENIENIEASSFRTSLLKFFSYKACTSLSTCLNIHIGIFKFTPTIVEKLNISIFIFATSLLYIAINKSFKTSQFHLKIPFYNIKTALLIETEDATFIAKLFFLSSSLISSQVMKTEKLPNFPTPFRSQSARTKFHLYTLYLSSKFPNFSNFTRGEGGCFLVSNKRSSSC